MLSMTKGSLLKKERIYMRKQVSDKRGLGRWGIALWRLPILLKGVIVLLLLMQMSAFAAIPQTMTYQGKLVGSDGVPLTGTYDMTFRIYNVESGGSDIWNETVSNVPVDHGRFNIVLGEGTPIGTTVFNGNDKWMGIEIESDGEMSPRMELAAVGYAFKAYNADLLGGVSSLELGGGGGGISTAEADTRYVNIDGDTMTGVLTVESPIHVGNESSVAIIGGATEWTHKNFHIQPWSNYSADTFGIQFITASTPRNTIFNMASWDGEPERRWVFRDASTDTDRMNINVYTGKVGIGDTNPASKLTVAGTIEITSGGIKFPGGSIQTEAATGGGGGISTAEADTRYVNIDGDMMTGWLTVDSYANFNGTIRSTGSTPPASGTGVEISHDTSTGWISSVTRPDGTFLGMQISASPLLLNGSYGGNVGVGSGTPGSKFSVFSNASIGGSYGSNAAPANGLIVEGNVGIGTNNPSRKLVVVGSVDIGSGSQATGDNSLAVGFGSIASGEDSAAIGYTNTAYDRGAIATGQGSHAKGFNSVAMGNTAIANREYSIAMGYQATAGSDGGDSGVACGYQVQATGLRSTAFGSSNTASGQYASAIGGWNNQAAGNFSFASGSSAIASGNYSLAIGKDNYATAQYAAALGANISAEGQHSFGIGLDDTTRVISQANTMAIMGGKVGVGVVNPSSALSVAGTIEITSGSDGGLKFADGTIQTTASTGGGGGGISTADADTRYVNVDGDTMTGTLTLAANGLIAGTNQLVLSSGNVGIGTASPNAKLELYGNDGSSVIELLRLNNFNSDATTHGAKIVFYQGNGATEVGRISNFFDNPNSSWNMRLGTYSSPDTLTLRESGNVGIGTTLPQNKLDVEGAVAIGPTYSGTDTAPANGLIVEGDVGIGTNAPENADGFNRVLDVMGASHSKVIATSTNIQAGIYVHESGYYGASGGGIVGTYTNHPISFMTNKVSKMVLLADGKLGIGTPDPKNKLDVEGGAVIGATYSGSNTAPSNGLLVEGNIGIGTTLPQNKLDIEGGAVVGAAYSGTNTAPTNGLLVEGNMAIGDTSATWLTNSQLTVNGIAGVKGAGGMIRIWNRSSSDWPDAYGLYNEDNILRLWEDGSGELMQVNTSGSFGFGSASNSNRITVNGTIETTGVGGIKFQDGTTQITASTGGGGGISTAEADTRYVNVGGDTMTGTLTTTAITLTSGGSKTITTPGNELILQVTGDEYGTVNLHMQNRTGLNGALLENTALDLADFGFKTNTSAQQNIRFAHNSAIIIGAGNTAGELQFGTAGDAAFIAGPVVSMFRNCNVGIGTFEPQAKLHVIGNAEIDGNLKVTGTIEGASPVKIAGGLIITGGLTVDGSIKSADGNNGLTVDGTIEATVGGIKFPDDTIQTFAYPGTEQKGISFLYPYATSEAHIRLPFNATITSLEVYCYGGTSVNGKVDIGGNSANATANAGAYAIGAVAAIASYTAYDDIKITTPAVSGAVNSASVLINYKRTE